jgi:hypothetical protein
VIRVPVKYLRELRHDGAVDAIAKLKFPFPDHDRPDYETLTNTPKHQICAGQDAAGRDLFPDIVVVRRPGQWLLMMAEVETADTLTDDSALTDWKPMSLLGELFIYVPAGHIQDAKKLCKRHGIKPRGFRTWRFRPVWGLEVTES